MRKIHRIERGFWLRAARYLLFLYAAVLLALALLGASRFHRYADENPEQFVPSNFWTAEQVQTGLKQLGWPATVPAYIDFARGLFSMLSMMGLGLLLLLRGPKQGFTVYLAFVYIGFAFPILLLDPFLIEYAWLRKYSEFMDGAGWQLFFIVFFFFPNGQPVPHWTRWVALAWLASLFFQPFIDRQFYARWSWVFIVLVLSSLASQVYRYFWRSNAVQRQQMKWIIVVLVVFALYVGAIAPFAFKPPQGSDLRLSLLIAFANLIIFNFLFILYPIVVAIAVLRYRLWDIDLVIRRTLVYTALTALLALVYLGMVTLLQAAFAGASRQQSTLALVISTLAIAALFNPLRRRIQQVIDRRFFRQRYDAAMTLERFSQNLRSQVELTAIERELAQVVNETIQPEGISLWIRKARKP